jgi:hypothetical protein
MAAAAARWTGDPVEIARRYINEQRAQEAAGRAAPKGSPAAGETPPPSRRLPPAAAAVPEPAKASPGWRFTAVYEKPHGKHLAPPPSPSRFLRYAVRGASVTLFGAAVSLGIVMAPAASHGSKPHSSDLPAPSKGGVVPTGSFADPLPDPQAATTTTSDTSTSTTTTTTIAKAPNAARSALHGTTTTSGPDNGAASATTAPPLGSPSTTSGVPMCTPGDLTITTSTNSASYPAGGSVSVSSHLVTNTTCTFSPVSACPTEMTVHSASGAQVYPVAGQAENCDPVPAETLSGGTALGVSFSWNEQVAGSNGNSQAPPGQYSASVTWWWESGGGGPPFEASAHALPFSVNG